ncbi:MAG: VOC family protein [Tepidiformaceae bacterium]
MPSWGVIPSIRVRDMKEAVAFYSGTLGFELLRGGPDEENISLGRGDARIMIESSAAFYSPAYNEAIRERLGTPSATALYIEAQDLEALCERAGAAGRRIIDPLGDRPWGQSEFTVEDPEGNWLTFWRALA